MAGFFFILFRFELSAVFSTNGLEYFEVVFCTAAFYPPPPPPPPDGFTVDGDRWPCSTRLWRS